MFSVVYFSRGTLPKKRNGKRALLGDLGDKFGDLDERPVPKWENQKVSSGWSWTSEKYHNFSRGKRDTLTMRWGAP